jgi:prolyl-tRNA synthetase
MVTGANIDDVHLRGVDVERDIRAGTWADLREVVAGEPCVRCGHPLELLAAIEVGHIFKLGYKFTKVFDVTVLNAEGQRVHPIMGSYGIGVERAMAAIAEVHHDDRGIVWPVSVAPFTVVVVIAQQQDTEVAKAGESVYEQLLAAGVEVIIDDRGERAGVKFRDAELTGIPFRVTVGKRGLADGAVEVTRRETGETTQVRLGDVVPHLRDALAGA